jgi:uncharacterized cupredoxin-like copper-binding protein
VRRRRILLGIVLAAGALLLAACGGGGDEGGGGETGGGGEEATTLTLTATEFAFDPATLSAPADEEVTIEVENAGTIEHDFTIDEANLRIATPATETASGTFTLPAGTYTFYCSVPGHQDAGMEGTLTVS